MFRSTFCTVMSQLTEETQPCFETTVKSKAVSEACNVKFTCVVTGRPCVLSNVYLHRLMTKAQILYLHISSFFENKEYIKII